MVMSEGTLDGTCVLPTAAPHPIAASSGAATSSFSGNSSMTASIEKVPAAVEPGICHWMGDSWQQQDKHGGDGDMQRKQAAMDAGSGELLLGREKARDTLKAPTSSAPNGALELPPAVESPAALPKEGASGASSVCTIISLPGAVRPLSAATAEDGLARASEDGVGNRSMPPYIMPACGAVSAGTSLARSGSSMGEASPPGSVKEQSVGSRDSSGSLPGLHDLAKDLSGSAREHQLAAYLSGPSPSSSSSPACGPRNFLNSLSGIQDFSAPPREHFGDAPGGGGPGAVPRGAISRAPSRESLKDTLRESPRGSFGDLSREVGSGDVAILRHHPGGDYLPSSRVIGREPSSVSATNLSRTSSRDLSSLSREGSRDLSAAAPYLSRDNSRDFSRELSSFLARESPRERDFSLPRSDCSAGGGGGGSMDGSLRIGADFRTGGASDLHRSLSRESMSREGSLPQQGGGGGSGGGGGGGGHMRAASGGSGGDEAMPPGTPPHVPEVSRLRSELRAARLAHTMQAMEIARLRQEVEGVQAERQMEASHLRGEIQRLKLAQVESNLLIARLRRELDSSGDAQTELEAEIACLRGELASAGEVQSEQQNQVARLRRERDFAVQVKKEQGMELTRLHNLLDTMNTIDFMQLEDYSIRALQVELKAEARRGVQTPDTALMDAPEDYTGCRQFFQSGFCHFGRGRRPCPNENSHFCLQCGRQHGTAPHLILLRRISDRTLNNSNVN